MLQDCVFLDVFCLCDSPQSPFQVLKVCTKVKGLDMALRKCKWNAPLSDPLMPTVFANKDSLFNSSLKVAVGSQEENQLSSV